MSLIALETHHIPHVFSPATLKEAEDARPVRLSAPREDWRTLPLVTIDPPDAKDHDDAVHAELDPDPANPGRVHRHRRHRRRRRLRSTWHGDGSGSARARQLGLFPRPGRADAAGAHLQRPLLAAPARGPARARLAHGPRRRRAQALAQVPPHHDALRGQAFLRAGPGGDRRSTGRDDRAASRHRAQAALRRLFGRSRSSASDAIRSISICPSASLFSIPRGGSRTCGGRSGSTRIG